VPPQRRVARGRRRGIGGARDRADRRVHGGAGGEGVEGSGDRATKSWLPSASVGVGSGE
jgi:hypothetical protein